MKLDEIPDRITIRLNEAERLEIYQLSKIINEEDIAKLIKFSTGTALHHIKFVTDALVNPGWEVIFQRKRKTQPMDRKVY